MGRRKDTKDRVKLSERISRHIEERKLRIKKYFLSFDVIHYFWFKSANSKEFKEIKNKNIKAALDALLEGVGGSKNLVSVKNTIYSVEIFFKSKYLIKEDLIMECGGLGIVIGDKSIFAVFDSEESSGIAKGIKREIINNKRKYIALDID